MIEEDFITLLHFAEIISRSEIAHSGPASVAVSNEVGPRIGRRFLFHQPKIFHVTA
jgi:hypothetical protein